MVIIMIVIGDDNDNDDMGGELCIITIMNLCPWCFLFIFAGLGSIC